MEGTYPTLTIEATKQIFDADNAEQAIDAAVEKATIRKSGGSFDEEKAYKLCDYLWELTKDYDAGGEKFDGAASPELHRRLELETIVAGDPGFWRWLTFAKDGELSDLVHWRYEGSKTYKKYGVARDVYFGLGNPNQSYYMWLWLRADAVFDDTLEDPYELARRGDVDIWDSHIIGVDMGSVPALARGFIRYVHPSEDVQALPRESKNGSPPGYRQLAREITRRNASTSFEILDETECHELIDKIWKDRETWLPISEEA